MEFMLAPMLILNSLRPCEMESAAVIRSSELEVTVSRIDEQ
jgi:hypothetical protein